MNPKPSKVIFTQKCKNPLCHRYKNFSENEWRLYKYITYNRIHHIILVETKINEKYIIHQKLLRVYERKKTPFFTKFHVFDKMHICILN